jgi:hypothetical protein
MLLPLPEASLLSLDLLCKAFPGGLFLLLELRVVGLLDTSLAKLASLHLFQAIVLVMRVLGGADKVQHVGANQERSQFAEIAVVLVLNWQ